MRTIRDTIFIRSADVKYEVSNHKWGNNDYDMEGWKNMKHSEDRPLPVHEATFDPADNTLNSGSAAPPMYLDLKEGRLYKSEKRVAPYYKVQ